MFRCGEWMAGEPSETLTLAATWGTGHTWWVTNAQGLPVLFVCPHTWALPIRTSQRATWHPYLRNGPHGEGARMSAASSRAPPQEAVLSSDFPTRRCTLNFNETCDTSFPVRPRHRYTWALGPRFQQGPAPTGSSWSCCLPEDRPKDGHPGLVTLA